VIIYKNSMDGFMESYYNDALSNEVEEYFIGAMGWKPGSGEKSSWANSLDKIAKVFGKAGLPGDCGVLVEFCLSRSSNPKRIDVIVLGKDGSGNDNFVIIELKQWETVERPFPGMLRVTFAHGPKNVLHPSEQAMDYKNYMRYLFEVVYAGSLNPHSCSYCHNYVVKDPDPMFSHEFLEIMEDTPTFANRDMDRLGEFLRKYVGRGDGLRAMYELENSRIRPSKKLVDSVASILKGNREYVLLDEQRVAFRTILHAALGGEGKRTVLVNGDPGTGKSVVAVNAMAELLNRGANVRFVAPNQAFRSAVTDSLAKGDYKNKKTIGMLFSGSSSFFDSRENEFDVIVVDEAHRLKKRGAFMYKGESQVRDIVRAARASVFFVDDTQKIRPTDEGSMDRIREVAAEEGSELFEVSLSTQFRCLGTEDYVEWVTDALEIPGSKEYSDWTDSGYDFRIFDDPARMRDVIFALQEEGYRARLLAGYAWPWTSARDGNPDAEVDDIVLPGGLALPWNSRDKQAAWSYDPFCAGQVGCIHTSQGLEFDYVGVIVGKDLAIDADGKLVADFSNYYDSEGKKGLRGDREALTRYVKNIYRVLMTRGMLGCYVYFVDPEMTRLFKGKLEGLSQFRSV